LKVKGQGHSPGTKMAFSAACMWFMFGHVYAFVVNYKHNL